MHIKKTKFEIMIIGYFFFLMMVLPTSYQIQRGLLLLLMVGISILKNQKLKLNKNIYYFFLLYFFISLFFTIYGFLLKSPGAIRTTTVNIFWPILYLYFIGANTQIKKIQYYMSVILWAGIGCTILITLFISNNFIQIPIINNISKEQNFSVGFYNGFIDIFSANYATMPYIFAFSLTLFFLKNNVHVIKLRHNLLINLCLLFSIILILISGRRAFWMILIVCPLIILIIFSYLKIKIEFNIYIYAILFISAILFIAILVFDLDIKVLSKVLLSSFDFERNESNNIRVEQFDAIMTKWKNSPFLGYGFGSSAEGSLRDEIQTWAYELSYMALLLNTGIIGVLVYSGFFLAIFYQSVIIIKKNKSFSSMLLPQLIALICFLIINATNPYLGKFDYLWTIFLPIASINTCLIDINNKKKYVLTD